MLCNGRSKLKLIFLIGEHLNGHYIYAVSSLDAETLKKYHSFTEKNNHTLKISTTLSFNPQAFRSKKTFIPLSLHTTHPIQTSILIQCTRKANHPSSIIHSQSSIPVELHAPHYQTLSYIPPHLHSYPNQCYVW